MAIFASACESAGGEGARLSSTPGPVTAAQPAGEAAQVSPPLVLPGAGAGRQAEKPGGGAPAREPPSRSGLSEPEFYRGTGALVRFRGAGPAEAPVLKDGRVSLNFADADIREVVDVVLGDTLNLNYIIDPRVQGTVVARTSEPLDRGDVIAALENILALNGAALRLVDGTYHVVPLQDAGRGLAESRTAIAARARIQGFTVTVIPLRFASAPAVHKVAASFAPPERAFFADPTRNLLVFAGTGTEAHNLVDLVRLFDVDWMAGMSFALLPVEVADVTILVSELEQVFGQDGAGALQSVVRFVPIKRMNAVLAISSQQAYLERAKLWVERLDRGEGSISRRIYVYYVQNSRAADLAEVLTQIFATGDRDGAAIPEDLLAPGLAPVELRGPAPVNGEQVSQAEAERREGAPQVLPAEAPYAAGRRAPGQVVPGGVAALISETGDIRVIADEKNNALVILATPAEYRMIEATLRRLDIIPLEVLIEATIAEVTLDDELEYGLQWFFSQGDFRVTFSESGTVPAVLPGFAALFDAADARVILNALTDVTDINVISSPQLMVLDNQSAVLQVGDQVPIVTQSAVAIEDPAAPIVSSIQYRDTGVVLEITPRVNASGLVVLDIIQEVSDVIETETSGIDSPTIQQRRIESTVAVQSGETIALGGLIRDNRTDSVTGVPLLSDIPILGNLFKTTSKDILRTELLVLITPRVVRNVDEARKVTEELRARMTGLAPLEQRIKPAQGEPMTQ